MNSKVISWTVTTAILGFVISQGASSALAGNNGHGGGNRGSNGNSGHNSNQSGSHNGNGGNGNGHHNFGPRYIGYVVPAYYAHRVNTHPVGVPVIINAPQSPVQLVNGVDLKLIDVRLADNGDAARNLGPRYRVKIANGGNQSAGNFQVTVVGSKDEEIVDELPRSTVDVAGVPSGKSISIDVRLPMEVTTMIDGNPFNILTVVVDSSEMVDEATEENNAGMLERTKIVPVNVASR